VPFMIFGGPIEQGEYPALMPGTRMSGLHSLVQVAPTILQMVGMPVPPSFDAKSILDILEHSRDPEKMEPSLPSSIGEHVMACTYHKGIVTRFNQSKDRTIKQAISLQNENDWMKYIFDTETMKQELYDIKADPLEKQDIAKEHKDILQKFHEVSLIYLKGHGYLFTTKKEQEMDSEKDKLLAALQRVKSRL